MSNNLSRRQVLKITAGFVAGATAVVLPSYVAAQGDFRNQYPSVRKNVLSLSPQEKAAFVNAVMRLKHTIPQGSKVSIYDQFTATHVGAMGFTPKMGAMSMTGEVDPHHGSDSAELIPMTSAVGPAVGADAAHQNSAFLPWHREYLRRFEQALQSVDPTVTLPYWDWTDSEALDIIFQPDFLGSNGQGTIEIPGVGVVEGGPVQSGNFSEASGWVLNKDLHFHPNTEESFGTSLLRFLRVPPADSYPIPKADQDRLLALDDYPSFLLELEGVGLDNQSNRIFKGFEFGVDNQGNQIIIINHNYMHILVGGGIVDFSTTPATGNPFATMSSVVSSPYDPVFWLLHANVDRLWAQWQDNGHQDSNFYPSEGQPYGHNLNDRMWPWDGGQSTPRNIGPGDLLSALPVNAPDDIVTPANVLKIRELGYRYDTTSAGPRSGNRLAKVPGR